MFDPLLWKCYNLSRFVCSFFYQMGEDLRERVLKEMCAVQKMAGQHAGKDGNV